MDSYIQIQNTILFIDNVISRQIVPEFFPSRSISRFVIIPSFLYIQFSLHHFDDDLLVVAEIDNHQYETGRRETKNRFWFRKYKKYLAETYCIYL